MRKPTTLAKKLKKARQDCGMDVLTVSLKLNWNITTGDIKSYERNVVPPDGVVSRLAKLYNRPVEWFTAEDTPQEQGMIF